MIVTLLVAQSLMDVQITRMRSDQIAERAGAEVRVTAQWERWSDADLQRLYRATRHFDIDVRVRSRRAFDAIQRRRLLGRTLLRQMEGFEAALVAQEPLLIGYYAAKSVRLWREGRLGEDDLMRIINVLDSEVVGDRMRWGLARLMADEGHGEFGWRIVRRNAAALLDRQRQSRIRVECLIGGGADE